MRILITVSDQVCGGKHRYMHNVMVGLRAAGHEVSVTVEQRPWIFDSAAQRSLRCC